MQGMRMKSHRQTVRVAHTQNEQAWKTGGYRPFFVAFEKPAPQNGALIPMPIVGAGAESNQKTLTAKPKANTGKKTTARSTAGPKTKKVARAKPVKRTKSA